jgi:hypothetical protein
MWYWFYVRTYSVTSIDGDGKKFTRYPLTSIMNAMKPSMQVTPSSEVDPHCKACNKAFALACRYSGVHDLVEEMVASKCWPLGKARPSMKLEMVKLPVFSEEAGVPFPCSDIKRAVDETLESLLLSLSRRHGRFSVIFLIRNI